MVLNSCEFSYVPGQIATPNGPTALAAGAALAIRNHIDYTSR